jgi:hypothetical protein
LRELGQLLDADVLSLGMRADEARRALPEGGVVTYLRVHHVQSAELGRTSEVPEAASEVRLYDTPDSLDDAIAQVRALRQIAGPRRAVAYSLADIEERARAGWGDVATVLRQLATVGLSDVAELPVDRLPDLAQSLRSLSEAGIQPRRLTVSHPFGDRKVQLLDMLREWLRQQPSAIRFAPLPRIASADKPTTGYEDVRMVALSRLAFDDVKTYGPVSIEVDWSLYGPKLAQVALTFGADHLDAVPATSDVALGPRRATVEDVERNIRAAGFEPREYRPAA